MLCTTAAAGASPAAVPAVAIFPEQAVDAIAAAMTMARIEFAIMEHSR
jgi:hypothetical protein